METKWNLDDIYTSVDSREFQNDLKEYRQQLDLLNKWSRDNFSSPGSEAEKLKKFVTMKNSLLQYSKLSLYVALALSVDTTNEALLKYSDMLEQLEAQCSVHDTMLIGFLKGCDDIDSIIGSSPILKEHEFFIREQKQLTEHTLSTEEENIIALMKNTGSLMWQKQWEQLTSTLSIPINITGEEERLPLSAVRNLAYSSNADIRKKAYEAELNTYKTVERTAAFSMNGIKGEVITVSDMRGYSSPLEMTLEQSRIDQKILSAMWSAIDDRLCDIQPYFEKKAQLWGHKNGLPFYDLFAPVGEDMEFTTEQARDFVIDSFYTFSKELGDFAKNAFDSCWIDLMPSEGKVGGAFCEAIHPIKQSRIMTNFGGTFNDVVTIAHELGHAFHDSMLYNATELNCFYPMPIAETASTFCEAIVINRALALYDKSKATVILENDLQGLTQSVIDIYSRFIFEDRVFAARRNGPLSASELNEIMLSAQKQAYGKGLDPSFLNSGMWVCKPHYYDSNFNYYNFPYAFGVLLSKSLYAMYKSDNTAFVPLYYKVLSASSVMPLAQVASIAGCDLYDKAFWNKGIDLIVEEINDFCSL